jgi:hypothetical protein
MTTELFWIPGPWKGKLAIVPRPRGGDWLDDEVGGWNPMKQINWGLLPNEPLSNHMEFALFRFRFQTAESQRLRKQRSRY